MKTRPIKGGITINIKTLAEIIKSYDNVLIISHINPDSDTIGSGLGLKYIFTKLNKTAYMVCGHTLSERMSGIFNVRPELDAQKAEEMGFTPEHIVCVDVASPNLLGKYAEYYSGEPDENRIDLVIDHHITNAYYGNETFVGTKAAATGEIIYSLLKELNIPLTQEVAAYIYCAIVEDTGSFKYSSTTPETLRTAADLISTGIDFSRFGRLIFENKSMTRIAVERMAYNAIKFFCSGTAAFITITNEMKKEANLMNAEIEGISDISRVIAGVEVGAVIKQDNEDETMFKVSLRSNEYVDVTKIAEVFGGGGHIRAAGCKIKGTPEKVETALEAEIKKWLK